MSTAAAQKRNYFPPRVIADGRIETPGLTNAANLMTLCAAQQIIHHSIRSAHISIAFLWQVQNPCSGLMFIQLGLHFSESFRQFNDSQVSISE